MMSHVSISLSYCFKNSEIRMCVSVLQCVHWLCNGIISYLIYSKIFRHWHQDQIANIIAPIKPRCLRIPSSERKLLLSPCCWILHYRAIRSLLAVTEVGDSRGPAWSVDFTTRVEVENVMDIRSQQYRSSYVMLK